MGCLCCLNCHGAFPEAEGVMMAWSILKGFASWLHSTRSWDMDELSVLKGDSSTSSWAGKQVEELSYRPWGPQ